MPSLGDAAQTRAISEQVAEATIAKFAYEHPEFRKAEIPPPLKWAGAIIAGLFTLGTATLVFWLVNSVSDMQVTLARMDERMASMNNAQESRFQDLNRRVTLLETEEKGGRQ